MQSYLVEKLNRREFSVKVPASKSILNRTLILAAFSEGDTLLRCNYFGEDTEALLACLKALRIGTECTENGILVHGTKDFSKKATLNVGSAGTAARFLTAVLAFLGGEYELRASEQMERRPMDLLSVLQKLGTKIEFLKEEGHFPFRISSQGVNAAKAEVGTDVSTQYASGLMLAAALSDHPFNVELTGARTGGSYLIMTARLIEQFSGKCERIQNGYAVGPIVHAPPVFEVEPDISGACYFYALSLLCGAKVTVEGVHTDTLQGDIRFLKLIGRRGVRLHDTEEGIVADGSRIPFYHGFDEDMRDYADQTLTLAVLAAFAQTPSILRNIAHIRSQECDRVEAAIANLSALGVRAFTNGEDLFIEPSPVHRARLKTYQDHRVAMAFSLVGLKIGGVEIEDPDCCKKTFPSYFEILDTLTE